MKLHKVEILNLNSLYGEHIIDFDSDLGRSPLFLIVGPTGAGKSTILDAICLSLFGQTPRLSRRSGNPDTDTGHIMSYGSGRCRACVEFSKRGNDGVRRRYRAVWDCRRAREKPEGNLQDPERSLALIHEDGTEEVLISDKRKKYFEPVFDDVMEGLTVEDFQRSVMLAQGEFAAFLQADEGVKASILERLTNTDEYKRIGQRASRKRREVERELHDMQSQLKGIQILDESEERELQESLDFLQQELEKLRLEHQQLKQITDWLHDDALIKQQLEQAQQALLQAQQGLETRAQDVDRLNEDERCQVAQTTLHDLDGVEQAIKRQQAATQESAAARQEAEQALSKATQAHQIAHEALTQAREALELKREALERGEQLERRIALEGEELERAQQALRALEQRRQELDQAKSALLSQHQRRGQALEQALESLKALEHYKPLGQELDSLKAQVGYAQEALQEAQAASERQGAAQAQLDEISAQLEQIAAEVAAKSASLTPKEERLEALKAKELTMLDGQPDVRTRRRALEQHLEQRRALDQSLSLAVERFEQLAKQSATAKELEEQAEKLQKRAVIVKERVSHQQEMRQRQQALVQQQSKLLHLYNQQLAVADHRKLLQGGDPCPLCGSPDHPFLAQGQLDELEQEQIKLRDEALQEYEELQAKERKLQDELQATEIQLAQLETEQRQLEPRRATIAQTMQDLLVKLNSALAEIGLPQQPQFPDQAATQRLLKMQLEQHQQTAKQDIAATKETLEALSALLGELEELARALRLDREAIQAQTTALEKLKTRQSSQQDALKEWSERAAKASEKAISQRHGLVERFISLKLASPDQADALNLDRALKDAQDALKRFESASEALANAQEALNRSQAEYDAKVNQIDVLNEQLQTTQDAVQTRRQKIEEQRHELVESFGERAPSDVRRELEQQIKLSQIDAEAQAAKLTIAKERFSREDSITQERQQQLERLRADQAELSTTLTGWLARLDLQDRATLEAKLLAPEERQRLGLELKTLREELGRAKLTITHNQERLEEHQRQRPAHEELDKREMTDWLAERTVVEGKMEAQHEDIGAVRQQLIAQQEARERSADLMAASQEKLKEYRIWETINKLIGQRDGESFKQFAQSLNLQDLVDRSNVRLKRLSPRYKLAVATGENGEPKLNFAVRDQHHAGFERPVTTLSGGETFLVSLALALALADFKRLDMPVETLLLDEGFGTLDQETLDVAMNTLRQLQQESAQQIGIISHVEALKERVDTRIVVEKKGNGRSELRVEHATWLL